jgi:hypothetical protein
MTIKLNLDRLDHDMAVRGDGTDAQVHEPSIYGAITGRVAVGRYVLQIGEPDGAVLREASPAERAHIRPRPTPILLRPRPIRGLLDRRTELTAALSALDAGLPVEASGESGVGKTAILRHLAHHPRAASFVDGVIYLSARHHPSVDLLQLIFEAFYESDQICKPNEPEIRRGLQDKQALILLDDVHLPQDELEQLLDTVPRSAFVVATRARCLWGEVRSVTPKGLPVEDAVLLLEREIERSLDVTERSAAVRLCTALGGHPLQILQAAALTRERGISLDGWALDIGPESLITELMASIDERQRRALLALTALPGVPLQVQHISGIAEVTDIEPSLMALVRCGLVVRSSSRHHLADGVGDRLRRTEDLKPWANRAITYFTAWAERHRRSPHTLLDESEALLRAQQYAADARRWGEVLRLGRLLEGALVVGARWGAWAITLERCLGAAKAVGDRPSEAWALHEIGTRAVCLGEPGVARAWLGLAVKLREALHDDAAATTSRRNLSFVLAPVSDVSRERATIRSDRMRDPDSLPLRDATPPTIRVPKTHGPGVLLLTGLLFAIFGWFGYWAIAEGIPFRTAREPLPDVPRAIPFSYGLVTTAGDPSTTPDELAPPAADTANILIFTARPGSIATARPTELCYAVSGASQVRIDPGVGDVAPTNTLSCHRVAPVRTTTYALTAYGRDGQHVSQQLVIVVR